ncbi:MAG: CaiB/BaiF CoA-transferase family protein, partial [Pseudomonadota bacterium]|nr:CaiB/BaiF CoA-transferase family protein [Pseudomonadota bacterium]
MTQPLSGITVLDFSTLLPGPLAGLILAESGARVIKIEGPAGDGMTDLGPDWNGTPALYASLNCGKERVTLDLKTAEGRERLAPLLDEADVLLEQFRPGVMTRLGLGFEQLKISHPCLIYCSITGYGQTGPGAQRAGHDLNYIGDSGILMLAPGAPSIPPVLAADIAAGTYPAVMNILLALVQRERNGAGAHLDISMTENMFPFAFWALPGLHASGFQPKPGGEWITGGSPRYRSYQTSDGVLACVAALEQRFWIAFCEAIGLEDRLASADADPGMAIRSIQAIIGARDAAHWRGVFEKADCCCTVARTLEEAVGDAHFHARGVFDHKLGNA